MRLSGVLLAATALLVLTACGSGSGGDPGGARPASAGDFQGAARPTGPPVAPPAGCQGESVVDVVTADELQRALDEGAPGQTIRLADGKYRGSFVATAQASADQPIHLCGSRAAVLDGGPTDGGYTLHLKRAAHWQVTGLTVTGGQKGVMVDAGVGNWIEGLLVTSTGDEGIHLRAKSTDNVVSGNTIRDTGLRTPRYGDGIYVGSAEINWCEFSDCRPDRSDRNVIENNDVSGTTAEAVDIKEGTSRGILRGNTFDGSAMVEADSWVDVKGNGWTVEGNTGTAAPQDGFQVHEVVDGWGRRNVFAGNSGSIAGGGFAVKVTGSQDIWDSTVVNCDNSLEGAGEGVSNVQCSGS